MPVCENSEFQFRRRFAHIKLLVENCEVLAVKKETVLTALEIRDRYQLGFYDSQIVAAALLADCQILFSEDMQDGMLFENRLRVVNPFKLAEN